MASHLVDDSESALIAALVDILHSVALALLVAPDALEIVYLVLVEFVEASSESSHLLKSPPFSLQLLVGFDTNHKPTFHLQPPSFPSLQTFLQTPQAYSTQPRDAIE